LLLRDLALLNHRKKLASLVQVTRDAHHPDERGEGAGEIPSCFTSYRINEVLKADVARFN
jgi:hypothetical protein